MDHLNTRTDLIDFICEHSSSAIRRACHTGTVNVLGGFSQVPPSIRPGWIIAVTSIHGRTWFVVVGSSSSNATNFTVWKTKQISWQYWIGDRRPDNPIFNGDNPERAHLLREATRND